MLTLLQLIVINLNYYFSFIFFFILLIKQINEHLNVKPLKNVEMYWLLNNSDMFKTWAMQRDFKF